MSTRPCRGRSALSSATRPEPVRRGASIAVDREGDPAEQSGPCCNADLDEMVDKPRVTLAEMAKALGLTKMSVSRALKGVRGVSETTRAKVVAHAEAVGYVPDPIISNAMARMRTRRHVESDTIAWLSSHGAPGAWRSNYIVASVYRGAEQQAARMGYQLEEFCLNSPGMTPRRLGAILYNRGVRGVVVGPLFKHGVIEGFPWKHFAAASCGHSLHEPRLNRVSAEQHDVVQVGWKTLRARGLRRIGLYASANDNSRVNNAWLSAFLGCQQTCDVADRVAPMLTDDWNEQVFVDWFKAHRPDALLSFPEVHEWLQRAEIRPPKGFVFALLNFDEGKRLPGVDHRFEEVGAGAVSLVASEVAANQLGIPEVRKTLTIECLWREAVTTPISR
ncbi:MAG: LacI family DNA-binding transcriptional regulator [Verrucomicrobiota bacterium]